MTEMSTNPQNQSEIIINQVNHDPSIHDPVRLPNNFVDNELIESVWQDLDGRVSHEQIRQTAFGTGAYIDPTNPPVVGSEIVFQHFDYMCQLIGNANHIGYGSDWIPDMNGTMKFVLANASTYPDGAGLKPGTTLKSIEMYGPTANPARILPALWINIINRRLPAPIAP